MNLTSVSSGMYIPEPIRNTTSWAWGSDRPVSSQNYQKLSLTSSKNWFFLCVFELLRVDNILSHRAVTWPKMVDQILAPPSKTHASLDLIKFVYKQSPRNIDRQNVPASISSSFVAMPKAGSECSSGLLLGNRSCDIGNALFFHSQT